MQGRSVKGPNNGLLYVKSSLILNVLVLMYARSVKGSNHRLQLKLKKHICLKVGAEVIV